MQEKIFEPMPGWLPLLAVVGMHPLIVALFIGIQGNQILVAVPLIILTFIAYRGFMTVQPNEAKLLLLFGEYKGSVRKAGFYFTNPFYSRKKISLKIRNFETGSLPIQEEKNDTGRVIKKSGRTSGKPSKVNDRDGNPIDISAVVVWKVVNTAEAIFEVEDFEDYIAVQSEAALRKMASGHPYDSEDHELSLRGNPPEIANELRSDIQDRLDKAGVEVIEARLSHLAYAPEIASAMLQRQQAQAVVAARSLIVQGAVGMVELAIDKLSQDDRIKLSDADKTNMVANLMVVLCGDRHAQPVIDIGQR